MEQEYITVGEFTRWAEDDREWKRETLAYVIDTRERCAKLEGVAAQAEHADTSAAKSKRWTVISLTVGAIINGFFLAFGGGK